MSSGIWESREKIWPQGGSSTQWALFRCCFERFAWGAWRGRWEVPPTMTPSGNNGVGSPPKRKREQGHSWEREETEREVTCPVVSLCSTMGQRAPKGSRDLGAFKVPGFVYLRLTDAGYSFIGHAKQAGSKWLKPMLTGGIFKTTGCAKFEFRTGRLLS